MKDRDPKNELPLNPLVYYALFALVGKTLHEYAIKKSVEAELGKPVPTATLYRHLRKMQDSGMIIEAEKPADNDDHRRQYFKLSKFGEMVRAAEYNRMVEAVKRGEGFGAEQPVLCAGVV